MCIRDRYTDKLRTVLDCGVDCFKTDFGERIPVAVVYHDGSDPQAMHYYYTCLLYTSLLLFAGLFYSISRRSLAEQKAEYEKRNNEIQTQAMKEMEAVSYTHLVSVWQQE